MTTHSMTTAANIRESQNNNQNSGIRPVVPPQTFTIFEPGNCSKSNAFSHHHRETHPQGGPESGVEHRPFDQWNLEKGYLPTDES